MYVAFFLLLDNITIMRNTNCLLPAVMIGKIRKNKKKIKTFFGNRSEAWRERETKQGLLASLFKQEIATYCIVLYCTAKSSYCAIPAVFSTIMQEHLQGWT